MSLSMVRDLADIASKIAIPFVLAWVGWLLVRSVESRKAGVGRKSTFIQRWADTLFETGFELMKNMERLMSILNQLQQHPKSEFAPALEREREELLVHLAELAGCICTKL